MRWRSLFAGGPISVPIGVGRNQRLVQRPRIKRLVTDRFGQFRRVHCDISRPRRDRSCLDAVASHQAIGVVIAHSIDNLGNLVKTQSPRPASVVQARQLLAQRPFA